jgi:hypothetical protein
MGLSKAWLLVLTVLAMAAAPKPPKLEAIADIVARVPARKGEFETSQQFLGRLQMLARSTHRVVLPSKPVYNADAQRFDVVVESQVALDVRRKGEAVGTTPMNVRFPYVKRDVTIYSLEPTDPDMFAQIDLPYPPGEARVIKGDLHVLVDFRIALPSSSDGRESTDREAPGSPLTTKSMHHAASLDSPWDGVLREHVLLIEVVAISVARRSSGQTMLTRAAADVQALREQKATRAKEAAEEAQRAEEAHHKAEEARRAEERAQREREEFEHRERAWPLLDEMASEESCRKQLAQGPSDLVLSICKCNQEELERLFPKKPPTSLSPSDKAKLAALGRKCLSATPAPRGRPAMLYFKPVREPAKQWTSGEQSFYLSVCENGLKEKYGNKRTGPQLRYQCECVGWHLQDQYSYYEFGDLSTADPGAAAKVVERISLECKRSRPAELGPDPG